MNDIVLCSIVCTLCGSFIGLVLSGIGFTIGFDIKNWKHKKNIKKLQRLRIKLMLNKG